MEVTMSFSKLAVLLLTFSGSVAVAQTPKEPDKPTLEETSKYICDHIGSGLDSTGTQEVAYINTDQKIHGTSNDGKILIQYRRQNGDDAGNLWVNILDLSASVGVRGPNVVLTCKDRASCIHSTRLADNAEILAGRILLQVYCGNATIAPHVARAFEHYIKLFRQEKVGSEPF
jgi:hypothetical protein